ncbi:hypothetical protein LguiA_022116 [Lonicera macranthoides]
MALPIFFGLKSKYNNKYVQYVKEDVEVHGLLRCSGENLVTPFTKYKTEMAKIGGGLVHIRCCYNNKYLVQRSPSQRWIIAGSDEPVEDMSSWSCTLFKPVPLDCKTIRFRHVQLGHYACLWRTSDAFDLGLFAGSEAEDKDQRDVFTIIDWESLCILPRHVAFKGDIRRYLGVQQVQGDTYLQFKSTTVDPPAINEVFITSDGSVRIMSVKNNRFWRYTGVGHDWIWPDSDDTTSDNRDTIFWPVKVVDNVIALRSLGNNNVYCKRFTANDIFIHLFSANSNDISREARLEVQQLATSRNIYNVNYHLKDARIYHQRTDLLLASGSLVNRTKEPYTFDMKLTYIDSKSKAWNASVWPNWGVETDIKASVPLVAGTNVEISADSIGVFEWEKMIEWSNISEAVYKITAPPMTRVKVNLLATEGSCDVPFSYDQRDTLMDGNIVTITMDDGIYTGINYYNFKYETEEEKL